MSHRVGADQPSISDPKLALGVLVYSHPELGAHAGRVVKLDADHVTIDFHDWIERFEVADISVHVVITVLILAADRRGEILIDYGLRR